MNADMRDGTTLRSGGDARRCAIDSRRPGRVVQERGRVRQPRAVGSIGRSRGAVPPRGVCSSLVTAGGSFLVYGLSATRSLLTGIGLTALALFGAAGCQSENKSKTYPARGKVVYKGTGENATRLAGAQVTLELVSDPKSVQVRGVIDDDGTFSLGSIVDGQNVGGAVPGEYRGRIVLSDGGF